MLKRASFVVLLAFVVGCGKDSPTTPTPTPTQSRIISIAGSLNFGRVGIGTSTSQSININNTGNSPMTVTGLSSPCGGSFRATFTNGVIPGPGTQNTTITFAPTAPQDCSGTLTVAADFTSGTNTFPINAIGTLDGVPIFTRSGSGDTVFDMPSYVSRVRITGAPATGCQNFIVYIAGSLKVNVIVGTCSVADARTYDGIVTSAGGTVEVRGSTGVNWSFTEVR
jgi:hypothetical protein